MRRIILLLLFALLTLPAQAQDSYRLRVPTAEEYGNVVEPVLEAAVITYPLSQYTTYPVAAAAMVGEVNFHFVGRNQLTYHQLETIYRPFAVRFQTWRDNPHEVWLREIVHLWLNENPTVLSEFYYPAETKTVEFDGYRLEVEPLKSTIDNYGGALGRYYIRLVEEPGERNAGYIVVPKDGGYLLPELPAPIDSDLLAVGDLNHDGDLDIAYLNSVAVNNSYNSGELIIASLRADNRFEQIGSLHYFTGGREFPPLRYDWWFTSVGAPDTTSIVQSQNLGTNWHCSFVQVMLFGWDEEKRLVNQLTENIYPPTFECLILQAEQAMWSHDFARAVEWYEQAFATGMSNADFLPHEQIRSGLAYLATGEADKAAAVFTELGTSESDFAQTVLAAYERDPRLLPVCQAMYRYAFEGEESLQSTGDMEFYDGGFNSLYAGWYDFDVDNATCDIAYHLDTALSEMAFPVDESPLARLVSLGLNMGGHIEADLNLDGVNEWLVWLDAPGIDPLFFSPAGDHYRLTRPHGQSTVYWTPDDDMRQPTAYNQYGVITLPNNTERVIVNADFDYDERAILNCAGQCGGGGYAPCTYGDGTALPNFPGDLTLWRMQDGELANMLLAPLCEVVDPSNLFASPTDRLVIHAGGYGAASETIEGTGIVPAIYVWDDNAQTYVIVEEPAQTPTLIPPTPQPETIYFPRSFYSLNRAFAEGDYTQVIEIAGTALENAAEPDAEEWKYAFHYWHALALEALNRPDEALAEYVAIYEAAPESAWGMLAALHIEKVE